MTLDAAWHNVHLFHKTFGHPANDTPCLLPLDRVDKRFNWIQEELIELSCADSILQQADAFIDIIYFAMGGLVEMGVRPSRLFEAVHRANMDKVWPDGSVRKREDGKILKPPGWIPPDNIMQSEILRQQGELDA